VHVSLRLQSYGTRSKRLHLVGATLCCKIRITPDDLAISRDRFSTQRLQMGRRKRMPHEGEKECYRAYS
jgi:hypothetical protein